MRVTALLAVCQALRLSVMLALVCLAPASLASAEDVWWPNIGIRAAPEEGDDSQPSIRDPGPDTADIPDSAFTVKPGVVYFETATVFESSKNESPRTKTYYTPTLIRVGMTERFELRFAGFLVHEDTATDTNSGVGPLTFGFKRHMWGEDPNRFLPAFGIIAQVAVPTASDGFDSGVAEPTIYFNFDYTLTSRLEFEWNGGLAYLEGDDGGDFIQGQFLWTVARIWGPKGNLKTFWHGAAVVPGFSGSQEEVVTGPGYVYFVSNRLALDGSYNYGVTDESPHRLIRLGASLAF